MLPLWCWDTTACSWPDIVLPLSLWLHAWPGSLVLLRLDAGPARNSVNLSRCATLFQPDRVGSWRAAFSLVAFSLVAARSALRVHWCRVLDNAGVLLPRQRGAELHDPAEHAVPRPHCHRGRRGHRSVGPLHRREGSDRDREIRGRPISVEHGHRRLGGHCGRYSLRLRRSFRRLRHGLWRERQLLRPQQLRLRRGRRVVCLLHGALALHFFFFSVSSWVCLVGIAVVSCFASHSCMFHHHIPSCSRVDK